jgi:hypothetical protein
VGLVRLDKVFKTLRLSRDKDFSLNNWKQSPVTRRLVIARLPSNVILKRLILPALNPRERDHAQVCYQRCAYLIHYCPQMPCGALKLFSRVY